MTAYLQTRLSDRDHASPKGVSVLVSELSLAGYTTIEEIDKILDTTQRRSPLTKKITLQRL